MITIGITGTLGAGKGTLVEYLNTRGFKHFSARKFLLTEVNRRGLTPIRDNISATGDDLRKKNGPSFIIEQLLTQAKQEGGNAIIESIRAIGEVEFLKKEAPQFYLFAIDADIKIRFQRILKRGHSTDHITFEKFIEDENKEMDSKEMWKMNVKACMNQSDFVFDNNGTVEELHKKVDEVLIKISPK